MPVETRPTRPTRARYLSYDEFLVRTEGSARVEWVDGAVVEHMPTGKLHHQLVLFLAGLMQEYAAERDLGQVLAAPFQMKLANVRRGREPDVLFVASQHLPRLKDTFLDGPADLVVEVVSPESALRDRGEKFAEYEAEAIPEYWILDPLERRADFWLLRERRYERVHPQNDVYNSLNRLPDRGGTSLGAPPADVERRIACDGRMKSQ